MTDHDNPTPGSPAGTEPADGWPEEEPTMDYPSPASTLAAPVAPGDEPLFEQSAGEDDEWLSTGPARGIRLRAPLAGLLALVLVAAGFWGGVALEKSHSSTGTGGELRPASRHVSGREPGQAEAVSRLAAAAALARPGRPGRSPSSPETRSTSSPRPEPS